MSIDLPPYAWAPGTRRSYQEDRIEKAQHTVNRLKTTSDSPTALETAELDRAQANLARITSITIADSAQFLGKGNIEETKQAANNAEREWRIASARFDVEAIKAKEDAKPEDREKAQQELIK